MQVFLVNLVSQIIVKLGANTLKDKSTEYRIVNDMFIFEVIWFIKGDYAKILLVEAIA